MDENKKDILDEELSMDYDTGIKEFAELLTFLPEERRLMMANVFVSVAVTY